MEASCFKKTGSWNSSYSITTRLIKISFTILALLALLLYICQSTSIMDFAKLYNENIVSQCGLINELRLNASSRQNTNTYKIGILVIVDDHETEKDYKIAKDSLSCYARLENYTLEYVNVNDNANLIQICPHNDTMLRRHCIAAHYIKKYDWTLFLDADIGVINPNHRIEEYIDDTVHLIFYNRFYNWEVMAGSYLAKNSDYSVYFLNEWANFAYRLPNSFHGTDNGVLHMVLVEQLAPLAVIERAQCKRLLNNAKTFDDLFVFEACARMILGANRYWPGKLKIVGKGRAWSRDGWITGTKYCTHDFMFHGWKQSKLNHEWYMPFAKPDDLAKCNKGYATFATIPGFFASVEEIENLMCKKYGSVEKKFLRNVAIIGDKQPGQIWGVRISPHNRSPDQSPRFPQL